jgi:small-conductance mechanosensitive channel
MSTEIEAPQGGNKRIALLIAILALMLAFSEIGGKNAEQDALAKNVEASNLWAFFQAKTIRGTTLRTAAEAMEVDLAGATDPATRERLQKRIDGWKATIARYESEPETNEGRKELIVRAKAAEAQRDISSARDDKYDIVSGLLQIAIVISSAAIITGIGLLAWTGGALGLAALALMFVAQLAPTALF